MILERNVIQVKFGKMKEFRALKKEFMESWPDELREKWRAKTRTLTDLSGTFYTLVEETIWESFEDMEKTRRGEGDLGISAEQIQEFLERYRQMQQKEVSLIETGRREFYTIEKE